MIDAASLKRSIKPVDFYRSQLSSFPDPRKQSAWIDGGLCPFHADRRPGSFFVSQETGAFNRFSCGAKGGDIVAFLRKRDNLDFLEALQRLRDHGGSYHG